MDTVILRGHYHNFGDWQGISGSVWGLDNSHNYPQPTYLDLSTVICDYCGSTYLAELIRSKQIMNCLGCGSARFHFGR